MPHNKPRLQLALYARPKHPDAHHYALFVSPQSSKQQTDSATKHHVKNTLQNVSGELTQPWRYERLEISDVQLEQRLLVRVSIAKVTSPAALERILEAVPIYQTDDADQAKAQRFDCVAWVQAALAELERQDAVAMLGEWDEIQRNALEFVERMRDEGRWSSGWKGDADVPVLDLLLAREGLLSRVGKWSCLLCSGFRHK